MRYSVNPRGNFLDFNSQNYLYTLKNVIFKNIDDFENLEL